MANTYYDSTLGDNEIEAVLETIDGLIVPANNGKILYVDNGQIKAKSPSSGGGSAVLEPLSVTENGDYYPGSGVDGFDEVHVNVSGGATLTTKSITQNGTYNASSDNADGYSQVVVNVSGGGGSVFAFVEVTYQPGTTVTATDGTTVLTGDSSGNYVFAIPNSGTWTISNGVDSKTVTISVYGSREEIAVGTQAVRIWTKSTSGGDAAMYIQLGIYANEAFIPTETEESVVHYDVRGTVTKDCYGLATLGYPGKWTVKALKDVSDGTNTFAAGATVKTWGFGSVVDFVVYEV